MNKLCEQILLILLIFNIKFAGLYKHKLMKKNCNLCKQMFKLLASFCDTVLLFLNMHSSYYTILIQSVQAVIILFRRILSLKSLKSLLI